MRSALRLFPVLFVLLVGCLGGSTTEIPQCAEDEVIFYDDYPDGNLICIHIDELTD